MATWDVTLSVVVSVDASSVNEAEDAAWHYWDTVCPDLFVSDVVLSQYQEDEED